MKRRERNDSLTLHGWNKFFHSLFMIITFPIRHPLIFIPLLIVAYLAPTFMGAKPTEVHLWYWNKIKTHTSGLSNIINEKAQSIAKSGISVPGIESLKTKEKAIEQVVEIPQTAPQNIRRQIFEKAKTSPEAIDVLKSSPQQPTTISKKTSTTAIAPDSLVSEIKQPEAKKKLPLVYTENGEILTGMADVKNANEIEIAGKSYFMHGIYVAPNTTKGIEAHEFLKKIIAENIIKCQIKAFTYQGVGTVICTVNGENINRLMVDRGYSKNVDLD